MANLHHTPRLIAHWERELSRALDTRNRRAASRIARTIADHQRVEAFEGANVIAADQCRARARAVEFYLGGRRHG